MSSKIKVDTIENVAGSGNVSLGSGHNLVVPGTSSIAGHASIGVDAVASTRALTVAGATDGSGSSALVVYNSSLASKFSVRDDGLTTITNNATVGGTLGVTGTATLSGNATIGTNSGDTRFSLNSANQYTMVLKNAGNIAGQIGGGGADDLRFSNAAGATTMQIKGGHISMPLQPAFVARKNGNQTVGAGTTQITGFTTILDVGSNWDNSQNRYTVPSAGIYLAGGFWQASGTTGLHFGILKNGAAYGNDSLLDVVDASANGYSVPFSMAANDYFTWIAYNSVTKTINANRSKIWVIKVA